MVTFIVGLQFLLVVACIVYIEIVKPLKFEKELKKYEPIRTYKKESLGRFDLIALKDLEKYLKPETLMQLTKNGSVETIDGKWLTSVNSYTHGDAHYLKAEDLIVISDYQFVKGYILPKQVKIDDRYKIEHRMVIK